MARLSVNVDHVATVRQARKAKEPDPVTAALIAEIAGADGITRASSRGQAAHTGQRRNASQAGRENKVKPNMAATGEMLSIALDLKPDMVTLVPEKGRNLPPRAGLT